MQLRFHKKSDYLNEWGFPLKSTDYHLTVVATECPNFLTFYHDSLTGEFLEVDLYKR